MIRCFWLLLLIYIGSNQMLKAQDTAHVVLKNHYPVDVCGSSSEKECTISISIGEVKPEDDFYGFNFEARYNREKFIFNEPLYINTLAQFFDNDKRNVAFLDSGLIRGFGGTYSGTSVYGNMPLIAFKGRFIGQCPDTSYIRLEWIEFTREFKKVVDYSNKYVIVNAEVADKPGRSITAGFENDTVIFDKADSTGVAVAKINVTNNTRLNNIEFELVTDDTVNFRIEKEDVKSITEKLKIDSLTDIENGYRIYTTIFDDIGNDSVFEIKIKELKRNGEIKELKLTPIKVNDCTCIKNLIEDKTNLKGNKEDTLGITEFENKAINGYYNEIKDKFIIETDTEIKEIVIYNILGNLIKKINISVIDKNAEIAADGLTSGVYLVTVRNMREEINKIVMIKN